MITRLGVADAGQVGRPRRLLKTTAQRSEACEFLRADKTCRLRSGWTTARAGGSRRRTGPDESKSSAGYSSSLDSSEPRVAVALDRLQSRAVECERHRESAPVKPDGSWSGGKPDRAARRRRRCAEKAGLIAHGGDERQQKRGLVGPCERNIHGRVKGTRSARNGRPPMRARHARRGRSADRRPGDDVHVLVSVSGAINAAWLSAHTENH